MRRDRMPAGGTAGPTDEGCCALCSRQSTTYPLLACEYCSETLKRSGGAYCADCFARHWKAHRDQDFGLDMSMSEAAEARSPPLHASATLRATSQPFTPLSHAKAVHQPHLMQPQPFSPHLQHHHQNHHQQHPHAHQQAQAFSQQAFHQQIRSRSTPRLPFPSLPSPEASYWRAQNSPYPILASGPAAYRRH